jgi:hypothetical protein
MLHIQNRKYHFWHIWANCFFCVFPINKKNIHFFEDHPVSIPNKFGSNCLVDFREKFEM